MEIRRQRIFLIIGLIFVLSFVFTRSASPSSNRPISRIKKTTLVRHIPDLPPANASLGFGAIAALSRVNSTRRAGLVAAANITELDIVIPDQPIWTDHDVELLKAVNGTRISRGSALAWLGHLNILKWFLSTDLETVLILEDDVDWDIRLRSSQIPKVASSMRHLTAGAETRDANSLLTHVKRNAMTDRGFHPDHYWGPKDSWDVMYLGHCGDMFKPKQWNFRIPRTAFRDDTLPDIEDLHPFTRDFLKNINIPTQVRIVHKSMSPLCTFGFALTRQAARRMLYDIAPHEKNGGTTAYDVRILEACRDLGLKCFTANPELFHHMDLPSEIEGIDKTLKKAREDAARQAEEKAAAERAAAEKAGGDGNNQGQASQSDGNAPSNEQQQQQQQGQNAGDQNAQPNSHSEAVQAAVQEGQQAQQPQSGGIGLLQNSPPATGAQGQKDDRPAIGLLKFDKRQSSQGTSSSQARPQDNQQAQAAPPAGGPSSGQASSSSSQDVQSQNQAAAQYGRTQDAPSSQDQQSQSAPSPPDQQSQPAPPQNQAPQSQDPPPPPPHNDPSPPIPPRTAPDHPGPNSDPPSEPDQPQTGDAVTGINATLPNGPGDEADKGKNALGFGKDEEGRLQSPLAGRAPNIRCGARSRTFFTKDAKTLEFLREVVGKQGQCLRDMIEEDMARTPQLIDRRERSWPY